MRSTRHALEFVVCFTAVVGLSACAALDAVSGAASVNNTNSTLTLTGRLDLSTLGEAPGGAHVTVFHIAPDGRLMMLPDSLSAVDDAGRFSVDVEAPKRGRDGRRPDLVVRVESSTGTGMVAIATSLSIDNTITIPPIDHATTVRAQAYLVAKNLGAWPADVSVARLHGLISEPLAARVSNARDPAGAIKLLANASAAAASAWHETLRHPLVGVTHAQLKSTNDAIDWAQFTLDGALHAAHDPDARAAAQRDFTLGVPLVFGLADIGPGAQALAAQAAVAAYEAYALALPPALARQAFVDAEQWRASYVTRLVDEVFYSVGTPSQRDMIHQLGRALTAHLQQVEAAATPGAIDAAIRTAWTDYASAVAAHLDTVARAHNIELLRAHQALQHNAAAAQRALAALDASMTAAAAVVQATHAMLDIHSASIAQAAVSSVNGTLQRHAVVQMLLDVLAALDVATHYAPSSTSP